MSNSDNTGGVGFAGLLTLIFITLKLTGHITWGWLWVLSPIWISFGLVLAVFLVALLAIGFINAVGALSTKSPKSRKGPNLKLRTYKKGKK
jgi:ABC-type nickel/cobalt efflux system permease component RcnA